MKIKMKNHKLVSFHRIRNMKESEMLLLDMDYLVLYSAKEIYFSLPFETTSFIIDSNSISSLENWWLKVKKSDQKICYYFIQPCFDVIHVGNILAYFPCIFDEAEYNKSLTKNCYQF